MSHWKLSQFAKQVGMHFTTVDGWFKKLEQKRIHYVNRVKNERVFNQLDLDIALHIKHKRQENWALDAIFDDLQNHFDLRPFPDGDLPTEMDQEGLKRELLRELEKMIQQNTTQIMKQLPDPEQERINRVNDIIARRKVESQLYREALDEWDKLPENERMTGFLFKREDTAKKDRFIADYIDKHFEERIKKEFNL